MNIKDFQYKYVKVSLTTSKRHKSIIFYILQSKIQCISKYVKYPFQDTKVFPLEMTKFCENNMRAPRALPTCPTLRNWTLTRKLLNFHLFLLFIMNNSLVLYFHISVMNMACDLKIRISANFLKC